MNRMIFRICLCAFLLLATADLNAQKTVTRSGSYTYPVPENVSLEDAKKVALEKARIQVIADEFGTIVDMTSMTQIKDSDETSSVEMVSYGLSDVKGEWIEDVESPEYEISYDQGVLLVTVTVKGRIREIVSADIDFKAKILRNGVEDRFEDSDFRNGDDFFISFLSPVNGYLAVYLYDGQDMVYSLIPYSGQENGCFDIRRNQRYVLFSPQNASSDISPYVVDEYQLTASADKEVNLIYVIFSPNKFTKALDDASGEFMPRSLDYKSFQKWLVKCRNRDVEMRVQRKSITISR